MNARDFLTEWDALGPQDENVFYQFLADRLYKLRMRTGHRVYSLGDVKGFLEELADVAKVSGFPSSTEGQSAAEISTSPFVMRSTGASACPRCGHVHEGDSECGYEYSPGRRCRCELDVPA